MDEYSLIKSKIDEIDSLDLINQRWDSGAFVAWRQGVLRILDRIFRSNSPQYKDFYKIQYYNPMLFTTIDNLALYKKGIEQAKHTLESFLSELDIQEPKRAREIANEITLVKKKIIKTIEEKELLSKNLFDLKLKLFSISADICSDQDQLQSILEINDFNKTIELSSILISKYNRSIVIAEQFKDEIDKVIKNKNLLIELEKLQTNLEIAYSKNIEKEKNIKENIKKRVKGEPNKNSFFNNKEKYDIFIAYYRDTASDFAKHLHRGLSKNKYKPFIDIIDIPNTIKKDTDKWFKYRDNALLNSKYFAIILTEGCELSPQLKKEINLAFGQSLITKLLYKHADLPSDLSIDCEGIKLNLKEYQYTTFETSEELLRSVLKEFKKS